MSRGLRWMPSRWRARRCSCRAIRPSANWDISRVRWTKRCGEPWRGSGRTDTWTRRLSGLGTLVFVAAEAREFDGFSRHVSAVRELRWPLRFCRGAIMNGREVVLLANGPGPALAVAAAKEAKNRLEKVDAFVSTGYCGALDSNLGRTAIVVASEVNGNRSDKPDAPAV